MRRVAPRHVTSVRNRARMGMISGAPCGAIPRRAVRQQIFERWVRRDYQGVGERPTVAYGTSSGAPPNGQSWAPRAKAGRDCEFT